MSERKWLNDSDIEIGGSYLFKGQPVMVTARDDSGRPPGGDSLWIVGQDEYGVIRAFATQLKRVER